MVRKLHVLGYCSHAVWAWMMRRHNREARPAMEGRRGGGVGFGGEGGSAGAGLG